VAAPAEHEEKNQGPLIEGLAALPFAEQVALLDRRLAGGSSPAALLRAAASLRDHEPAGQLLERLVERGALAGGERELEGELQRLLASAPDTCVQRLLRALPAGDAARSVVVSALGASPLGRLSAVCLLDRWLGEVHRAARDALRAAAVEACARAIEGGLACPPADRVLLDVPGSALAALGAQAEQRGVRGAWQALLEGFASRVLELLEAAPRSLSQANAEQLLARRVYEAPGHFLAELLQNAEDAGARRFGVAVADREVVVSHDGAPFDARDVVGVLSIGQSTKLRGQIGLFGVGFKSVHQITDRPRVYSGPFRFEIRSVSLPRALSGGPPASRHETRIVLPLRPGAALGPGDILELAMAIPAHTLLTLSSVRVLEVEGLGARRSLSAAASGGRVVLRDGASGREEVLLVEREGEDEGEGERQAEAASAGGRPGGEPRGERAAGGAMVAVLLDDRGLPRPLPAGVPSVYCFLPTAEPSGLRVLVHGPFDVPLDRERIDHDSARNRATLLRAGGLLARLAARVAACPAEHPAGALPALLALAPLPGEASHAIYGAFSEGVREVASGLPLLPSPGGRLVRPAGAALLFDEALEGPLADVELGEAPGALQAAAALPPRLASVACFLGATRFGPAELAGLLARSLRGAQGGEPCPVPWLLAALPEIAGALGRAAGSPAAARGAPDRGAGGDELARALGELPWVVDQRGLARRPRDAALAPQALRALYGDARPLLDEQVERSLGEAGTTWLSSLGALRLGAAELVEDLADPRGAAGLLARARAQAGPLVDFLGAASPEIAARAGLLAVFPDDRGALWPLAGPGAAWLLPAGALGAWLSGLGSPRPPLLASALSAGREAALRSLGARALELPALIDALLTGGVRPSPAEAASLLALLDDGRAELSPRLCQALARAQIFPDRSGQLRPLLGAARALRAEDDEVASLLPSAPWLDPASSALPLLSMLPGGSIGPEQIALALLGEAGDALELLGVARDAGSPRGEGRAAEGAGRALRYVASAAGRLRPALVERLRGAPLFPSASGGRAPARALRAAPRDASLARLYARWPARPLLAADPDGAWLDAARGLGAELSPLDHGSLVDDLVSGAMVPEVDDLPDPLREALREDLAASLCAAAAALRPERLEPLLSLPLFRAESGARMALARWGSGREGCRRGGEDLRAALREGRWPLLAASEEARFSRLLEALGVGEPGALELLAAVEPPWAGPDDSRAAARRALAGLAAELAVASRGEQVARRLGALPLWRARSGAWIPASLAVRPAELAATMAHGNTQGDAATLPEHRALGVEEPLSDALAGRLLDRESEPDAAALAPLVGFCEPRDALRSLVAAGVLAGRPLADQPPFASSAPRLVALLRGLRAPRTPRSERPPGAAEDPDAAAACLALPLGLDLSGNVVAGRIYLASPEDAALCRALGLGDQLADPAWAALAAPIDPGRAPPLPAYRLCEALAAAAPAPRPPAAAGALADPGARAACYAFVLARAGEIEAEPRAWGPLGHACFVAATGGLLRSPRQLLLSLDDELPELPLDGRPEAEVPALLRALFARLYRLEETRERQLARSLLDAHDAAAQAADGARALAALGALARTLGVAASSRPHKEAPHPFEPLSRALRLSRRVRVEIAPGSFVRPRDVVLLDDDAAALVAAFHPEPPPRPAPRDGLAEVEPLLALLGAPRGLRAESLSALLRGEAPVLPGSAARLALARYVAQAAILRPQLREALSLDRASWVPAGDGRLRRPDELYWPGPGVGELLGHPEARLVHPELSRTAPASLGRWLPFKHAEDASLHEVLAAVPAGHPAPLATLVWLERGLSSGRLAAADVRRGVGQRALLRDSRGQPRGAAELVLPGADDSTGNPLAWPDALVLPRLGAALRVGAPARPSPAAPDAPAHARPPAPARPAPGSPAGRSSSAPASAGPPAAAPPPAASAPHAPPQEGLGTRLRKWFLGETDDPPAPRPGPGASQGSWFRPSEGVGSQLGEGPTLAEARAERPEFGFAVSPARLPAPYLYAPRALLGTFDPGSQRWLPAALPAWVVAPHREIVGRASMAGRLPRGEVLVPVPLYASLGALEADGARPFVAVDGSTLIVLPAAADVRCELLLRRAPRFLDEPLPDGIDQELLAPLLEPTVPDRELPDEALSLVDALRCGPPSALARALEVRAFVRQRYRYDPSYLEARDVARWLERASRGRASAHLAALHAGGDAEHLGAGVCYELNALACELMRRAGVPALLCTGWTLDGEQLTAPDHLWAMALVASDAGPRLLPIDASTTVEGRPIQARPRQAGAFRAARQPPGSLPATPPWATPAPARPRPPAPGRPLPPAPIPARPRAPSDTPARSPRPERPAVLDPDLRAGELARFVHFLEETTGERPSDDARLRKRLRALLADREEVRRLLAMLRGA
jgi:hypothetical protein